MGDDQNRLTGVALDDGGECLRRTLGHRIGSFATRWPHYSGFTLPGTITFAVVAFDRGARLPFPCSEVHFTKIVDDHRHDLVVCRDRRCRRDGSLERTGIDRVEFLAGREVAFGTRADFRNGRRERTHRALSVQRGGRRGQWHLETRQMVRPEERVIRPFAELQIVHPFAKSRMAHFRDREHAGRNAARDREVDNALAAEHIELAIDEPEKMFKKIRHAGSVFLGRMTPEAIGDYVAGPNHVLPTGRRARFSSGLSVLDFMKRTSFIAVNEAGLQAIGPAAVRLAEMEGLPAHAKSVQLRLT